MNYRANLMMNFEKPNRVEALVTDISLLGALGEVLTIQIDFEDAESFSANLREQLNDSEKDGLYIDGMIFLRITENRRVNYKSIFQKVIEITGNCETIDTITALIKLHYKREPVEVTVQLLGGHKPPYVLQVTDQSIYFELNYLIQTQWYLASKLLN